MLKCTYSDTCQHADKLLNAGKHVLHTFWLASSIDVCLCVSIQLKLIAQKLRKFHVNS